MPNLLFPARTLLAAALALTLGAVAAVAAPPALLVEADTGLIVGGYRDGKWLPNDAAAKNTPAGLDFRFYDLTRDRGKTTGAKPASLGEPCPDLLAISLDPGPQTDKHDTFAVHAPWNPQPRTPRIADTTQEVYRTAVREILTGKGIRDPKIRITQILRVDLDGDGTDEVLISATNYLQKDDSAPSAAKSGTYSFVALRREIAGKVQTSIIEGEFYPKAKDFNAPYVHRVGALLDLDGDGRLEIVVSSGYYEGGATTVYKLTPKKLEKVLEIGCGA